MAQITGGTGFVGFRVIIEALNAGYKVRAAIRGGEARAETIRSAKSIQDINPGDRLTFIDVPDILDPKAYHEAIKGVHGVIHVASPMFTGFKPEEYEDKIVKTAVSATTNMLNAAKSEPSVKRVVITSSLYAAIPYRAFGAPSDEIWSTELTDIPTARPFSDSLEAYAASKVYASHATVDWIKQNSPSFDVINMLPAYVLGRSELTKKSSDIMGTTNSLAMLAILGIDAPASFAGTTVHVNDVAALHVQALDRKIPGGSSFALNSNSPKGTVFQDATEIVARNYAKAVQDGVLPNSGKTTTLPLKFDASATEKTFGVTFRSFEEQVKSVVDQYLELKAAEA